MTTSGQLRKQISLQHPDTTTGTTGQQVPNWTTYATPWASLKAVSCTEHEVAHRLVSVTTWEVVIRYRSDMTPEDRILWTYTDPLGTSITRTLAISGSPDPDERNRWLTITCHEVGNN
jgi:SPP1 family predicted phage head-tail adaptor